MVKRTANIAALLLVLSLCTFGQSTSVRLPPPKPPLPSPRAVPEPGNLLEFGTALLLGFGFLRRKLNVR